MGLISPGEEKLLDVLEMRQVLSTYDGDLWDPQKPGQLGPGAVYRQDHSRFPRGKYLRDQPGWENHFHLHPAAGQLKMLAVPLRPLVLAPYSANISL